MKRTWLTVSTVLLSGALLAGCTAVSGSAFTAATSEATPVSAEDSIFTGDLAPESVLAENANITTVNDDEWSEDDAVDVELTGTSASSTSDGVAIEGSTVTITAAGVYRLSGELAGQVIVAAPDDALVVLVLDGAKITNDAGAAIDVQTADDVAISLAAGSRNSVSDAASYAEDATANAAIYAATDLTITGTGALSVTGNGNDGVTSTDDLVILSGALTVTAADDALRGKDALAVEGGTLTLTATAGDGLKSDQESDATQGNVVISGGAIDVTAGDDGVQAQADTVISGGEVTVSAADDGVKGEQIVSIGDGTVTVAASLEGIEAGSVGIGGGTVSVTASDDGINGSGATTTDSTSADSTSTDSTPTDSSTQDQQGGMPGGGGGEFADTGERVEISGGIVTVNAEGDGLDSNGSLTISGGDVTVYGPTNSGNGALDANGDLSITGGTVLALGSGGMEQAPGDSSTQGWVMLSSQVEAGQKAAIVDSSGSTIGTVTAAKATGAVIYSSAEVEAGATYELVIDGSSAGTAVAGEAAATQGPGGNGGGFGGAPDGGQPPQM